jgi:hypothetical protein
VSRRRKMKKSRMKRKILMRERMRWRRWDRKKFVKCVKRKGGRGGSEGWV